MTDSELRILLSSVKDGDTNAFEKLYTALKAPVFTLIMRIVRDRYIAEDVMQELFIKLYRSPPNVSSPRPYIYRMARNLAIDSVRRDARIETVSIDDDVADSVPSPDPSSVSDTLSVLSPSEREIVTLRINAELKFREIADVTSTPLGTVLWRYNSAIEKLRRSM